MWTRECLQFCEILYVSICAMILQLSVWIEFLLSIFKKKCLLINKKKNIGLKRNVNITKLSNAASWQCIRLNTGVFYTFDSPLCRLSDVMEVIQLIINNRDELRLNMKVNRHRNYEKKQHILFLNRHEQFRLRNVADKKSFPPFINVNNVR